MMVQLSNTDSLLVAIPMVGFLFAVFFRLDENGRPMCVDPDGQVAERRSRKS